MAFSLISFKSRVLPIPASHACQQLPYLQFLYSFFFLEDSQIQIQIQIKERFYFCYEIKFNLYILSVYKVNKIVVYMFMTSENMVTLKEFFLLKSFCKIFSINNTYYQNNLFSLWKFSLHHKM